MNENHNNTDELGAAGGSQTNNGLTLPLPPDPSTINSDPNAIIPVSTSTVTLVTSSITTSSTNTFSSNMITPTGVITSNSNNGLIPSTGTQQLTNTGQQPTFTKTESMMMSALQELTGSIANLVKTNATNQATIMAENRDSQSKLITAVTDGQSRIISMFHDGQKQTTEALAEIRSDILVFRNQTPMLNPLTPVSTVPNIRNGMFSSNSSPLRNEERPTENSEDSGLPVIPLPLTGKLDKVRVKPFNGEWDQARSFISNLEVDLKSFGVNPDAAVQGWIIRFMEGEAHDWFDEHKPFISWLTFKHEFKARFTGSDTELKTKIQRLSQNKHEQIVAYFERAGVLYNLMQQKPVSSEMCNYVTDGLKYSAVRTLLYSKMPGDRTWQNLRKIPAAEMRAIQAEHEWRLKQDTYKASNNQSAANKQKSNGGVIDLNNKSSNSSSTNKSNEQSKHDDKSKSNYQGKCYKCGSTEHKANECPEKTKLCDDEEESSETKNEERGD